METLLHAIIITPQKSYILGFHMSQMFCYCTELFIVIVF